MCQDDDLDFAELCAWQWQWQWQTSLRLLTHTFVHSNQEKPGPTCYLRLWVVIYVSSGSAVCSGAVVQCQCQWNGTMIGTVMDALPGHVSLPCRSTRKGRAHTQLNEEAKSGGVMEG